MTTTITESPIDADRGRQRDVIVQPEALAELDLERGEPNSSPAMATR